MELSFVTGKGGVGKTRVSLALANANPRFALAETSKSLAMEAKKMQIEAPPIFRFTRVDLAEDFLVRTLKLKAIAQLVSRSKMFQMLFQLAPNLHELLLLDKWSELAKEQPLIVDAPSTGNFIALFDAIKTARNVFDGGSLKSIADEVDECFSKPGLVKVYIVSIPENSALEEAEEIETKINKQYPNMQCIRVLNRKHEEPGENILMSSELSRLAYDRPRREDDRIKNIPFDLRLPEGGLCL